MRYLSSLGLTASVLAVFAACSSDEGAVVTSPGTYMAPVADYDTALDAAMWDSAVYDPILIGIVVAQVTPCDAEVADASGDRGRGGPGHQPENSAPAQRDFLPGGQLG